MSFFVIRRSTKTGIFNSFTKKNSNTFFLKNDACIKNDKELKLTRKEFELLVFFISNKNKVITKSSLAEHLWGDYMDTADSFDFIYTHIKNLRNKLLKEGCTDYIKTVYGLGYKFDLTQ